MQLSTKLFTGFAIMSVIFTAVAFFNFQLSEDVHQNSLFVANSMVIVRNSAALQRSMTDMETGMRGYLLTGIDDFLAPYTTSENQIPGILSDLEKLVKNSPVQMRQLEQIKYTHSRWQRTFAEVLIAQKRASKENPITGIQYLAGANEVLNLKGKKMMDSLRELFRGFNRIEYQVREAHQNRLASSIAFTRGVSTTFTLLSVIIGLYWAYYITTSISRRIINMVSLAEKISAGEYKTQIQDEAKDEISFLATSLNKMANTIDLTITELEVKNKELDQFAYVVSHDLKAPLRGIENASRWIEEDMGKDLPHHIQEYLMLMRVRVHRMENLINGILALARIGRVKQAQEVVHTQQLLEETVDLLSPPEHINIQIVKPMPVLYTVRISLEQVFSNLISNAIKYHDKEQGLIIISHREEEQYHTFSVIDDGPGIDPAYHDRIFVIFQTLQERDAVESTGVGLAIVKKIIERQGGWVQVKSEPGTGSTFTFSWPK